MRDDVPIKISTRTGRVMSHRWLAVRIWTRVWLTVCTVATFALVGTLVSEIATHDDPDRTDSIGGIAVILGLVGIIWLQALLYHRMRRRQEPGRFGWRSAEPPRHLAERHLADLGADTMVRIANLELSLTEAFDTLGPYVPADDLVLARQIGIRAAAALRDLRAQSLTLSRHTAAALAPDRQRLAAARRAVILRLTRGLRDCEDVVLVASTPEVDNFRLKFTDAVERMSILVADINP
ncbi:MAG TPA: hypothetical protein VH352_20080 [Pseudonocardiaceae bacterium]|nr:hypothetical protein [Pseudonocardiaceae bacterium]